MHRHGIHTGDPQEVPGVPAGACLLCEWGLRRGGAAGGGTGDGCRGRLEAGLDEREGPCNVAIRTAELGRVEIEEGQGLVQDKQMLLAPRAGQRQGNLICILLTAVVA